MLLFFSSFTALRKKKKFTDFVVNTLKGGIVLVVNVQSLVTLNINENLSCNKETDLFMRGICKPLACIVYLAAWSTFLQKSASSLW